MATLAGISVYTAPTIASLFPRDTIYGRSFQDLQGDTRQFTEYLGKPLLLNFWASWCAPCVREMPLLQSLHQSHPDLAMVGLAIDTKKNVLAFLESTPVSYDILLAGPKGISIMRELGNKGGGLPFSVLFDAKGKVVDQLLGELEEQDIKKRLQRIL